MNSADHEAVDIVLLAGDRGPDDPLAHRAGVRGKALVPVAGISMLQRVLMVLQDWPRLGRVILVAPAHQDYRAAAEAAAILPRLIWVEPQATLNGSVRAGIQASTGPLRLVLTADHALLSQVWLDQLLEAARGDPETEVFVGLADWTDVMARFPGSRRTRYRFSDRMVCGTNLFVMRKEGAMRLLDLWRQVERERKRPWRIVALLGWRNLGVYLAGRLSLAAAFAALSERLQARVRPLLLDDPLTAVDVDSLADHALVEAVLAERERPA